jgi:hypothetical protein
MMRHNLGGVVQAPLALFRVRCGALPGGAVPHDFTDVVPIAATTYVVNTPSQAAQ